MNGSGALEVGSPVLDAFDLKAPYGLDPAPGVVLVLDGCAIGAPRSPIGRRVRVRAPSGRTRNLAIADVRDHGPTISLFFEGSTSTDLPIGSVVEVEMAVSL